MNDLSDPKRAIMREPGSPGDLLFDNSFVRSLPADPVLVNRPRQVQNACYTRVEPTPVAAPRLLGWSDDLGRQLGIGRPSGATDPLVEVLAGNRVLPGMQPYAARYGGHQFGHWAARPTRAGPMGAPCRSITRPAQADTSPMASRPTVKPKYTRLRLQPVSAAMGPASTPRQ